MVTRHDVLCTYKLHYRRPMFIDKHLHIIEVHGAYFNTCYMHILKLVIELNTWHLHHVTHQIPTMPIFHTFINHFLENPYDSLSFSHHCLGYIWKLTPYEKDVTLHFEFSLEVFFVYHYYFAMKKQMFHQQLVILCFLQQLNLKVANFIV
jgi:hypothetical protein